MTKKKPKLSNVFQTIVLGHGRPLFFFKQKTAYEISLGLVGSEMCIRDRVRRSMTKKKPKLSSVFQTIVLGLSLIHI